MEQAMIGLSPNPLILSYLKYAVSSQVRGKKKKMLIHTDADFVGDCLYRHCFRWCLTPVCLQPLVK